MGRVRVIILLIVTLSLVCSGVADNVNFTKISEEAMNNITYGCSSARFEDLCLEKSLNSSEALQAASDPVQFVKLSMKIALEEVRSSLQNVGNVTVSTLSGRYYLEDTMELLTSAQGLVQNCIEESLETNISLSNCKHWLSASLTYVTDCQDLLGNVHTVTRIQEQGIPLLSNALWILDAFKNSRSDFALWTRTEPSQYHYKEWNYQLLEQRLGAMDVTVASATVSKDPNHGTHTSIQAAVDAAPESLNHRYVIYIRAGVYDELVKIPSTKPMISFFGDGINETVITGNLSTAMNISTFRTATLAVAGNGFIARDITVMNTAGPDSQAVAMRVDSDMAAFHRCSFWGYQDTLYTHAYRQFYKECVIYGNIDFIFGNAASVFQNCDIRVVEGGTNRTTATITAQGRTDPAQDTAFVCQSCWVASTPDYMTVFMGDPRRHPAYLGRPWKSYARAIFIESYLDVIIEPSGWLPWNATDGLGTAVLAEFRNYGPGSDPGGRVSWSKQLTTLGALQYSVGGLIQGNFWLPFTGVPYRLIF